jgi:hypothetical protein
MTKKIVLWAAALAAVAAPLLGRALGAPLVRAGQESNATPPGRARLAARAHPSGAERLEVRATPVAVARPAYEASLHRALAAELDGGVTFGAGPAPAGPAHAGFTLVATALPQRAPKKAPFAMEFTFDGSNTCNGVHTCYGWQTCMGWSTCDGASDTCWATCDIWATCFSTCETAPSYCYVCGPLPLEDR